MSAPRLASLLATADALFEPVATSSGTVACPVAFACATRARSPLPRPLPWLLPGFATAPPASTATTAIADASTPQASQRPLGPLTSIFKMTPLPTLRPRRQADVLCKKPAQSHAGLTFRQGKKGEGRPKAALCRARGVTRRGA